MFSNNRLLVIASLIIIFGGILLLYLGLKPTNLEINQTPTPITVLESTPIATSAALIQSKPASLGLTGERVVVTKVIDGDTIEVGEGIIIRLIGIDTPETKDPRRSVGCFGKEASLKTKELLNGKEVILQKDVSETDKYHRLLRYVFLPLVDEQILFVNDYLVREGFAKVLTYPPDIKYNEQLRQAEIEAKEGKKGLWGRC